VAGTYPTPDQRGILNTVPAIVAACQATLAYRLLTGVPPPAAELLAFNAWAGTFRSVAVRRNPACVCCGLHQYGFLNPAGKG
jgi:molybdopterin/thiamine biosynthesis adenylyltransferase